MSAGEGPLLATLPLRRLLAGVLRLAVPADLREEFLGDLIEEAHLRRARSSASDPAMWLWGQVLRSLPMLLGLRLRGLAAGGWTGTPARPGGGLLVAARGGHRGWPLPVAVSVSAHVVVVVAALGWLFIGRVDEVVEPVRTPFDVLASIVGEAADPVPDSATPVVMARDDRPAQPRRGRGPRRVTAAEAPQPPAGLMPGPERPGTGVGATTELRTQPPAVASGDDRAGPGGPVALPPRIAEKRCLTCPTPQLPPAYAHLARGQDMLVRTCVSSAGEVTSVNVVRGFDTTVNREVMATVRHWRLVPYHLNGHPVPFCYATRFIFASS